MSRVAKYLRPRDEIMQTMERIYRYRMTTTSGGNLSIREPDGTVWVTPARVDKGGLRREDIVRVRPDGSTEGLHPPSSELPFHQMAYGARPDIRGVVHAHAVAPIALLENDGVLVLGANVLEAFDRLEVLESTSEALVNSRLIGEVAPMSDEVIDDLKRAFASMLA
jgi:ribulose-5-phosphate 4-epimerase/fuculose-1-phosphate aldolase